MEGFMTTKEAAEKWDISVRQVQNHCKNGRIKGILRVGTNYLIPKDAMKPTYCAFSNFTKKEPLPIPKPGIDRGSSFILWAFE